MIWNPTQQLEYSWKIQPFSTVSDKGRIHLILCQSDKSLLANCESCHEINAGIGFAFWKTVGIEKFLKKEIFADISEKMV